MEENKFKKFVKNNFIYFIIAFACLAYIAFGLIKIETTGKSVLEIIGSGIVIYFVGYVITLLFSMQGQLAGDRQEDVVKTNKLHAKCVEEIDPKINEMDDWCEEENVKALQKKKKRILNKEGLRYEDCFDKDGIATDIVFPLKSLKEFEFIKTVNGKEVVEIFSAEELKETNPSKYKVEKKKIKNFNKRQVAKQKAFLKAMRVKITPLTTDLITATVVKNNDPHNLGMDRKQYQKKDAKSEAISRAIFSIVFAYFTVSFISGWATLISSVVQIAIFLCMGGIKWVQSFYFVKEDLRKRTIRQINYIQKFKCDKGINTTEEEKQIVANLEENKEN